MSMQEEFELDVSLSVLEDLGIRLYSSIPAVLSEIVANAWDADANSVSITLDTEKKEIRIKDDGDGMTMQEVKARFLRVGYRRRKSQPAITKKNRQVMGRKGIGKLAPLAISEKVTVCTVKDKIKTTFVLDAKKIKEDIENDLPHRFPASIENTSEENGTVLLLQDLRSKVNWADAALRKRISLRFSILGSKFDFVVKVNGKEITKADVDFLKSVEFVWKYGQWDGDDSTSMPFVKERNERSNKFISEGTEYEFTGWIGTVKFPSDLMEGGDHLGGIPIYVRGKVAHENVLTLVNDDHIFTKYLVGEIHAEFLDDDSLDDIATSSRQSLIESDPRVEALRKFIKSELNHIASKWTITRNKWGGIKVEEIPAIKEYLSTLPKKSKKVAQSWLGKIWAAKDQDPENLAKNLSSGILLCENLRISQSIQDLEKISPDHLDGIAVAFETIESIEALYLHQLVDARVKVVDKLANLVGNDSKEKVLQNHIGQHLWLLNPSWDVVPIEGTREVEVELNKLAEKWKSTASESVKKKRLDIFYTSTESTHVIIELKKYTARETFPKIHQQVKTYANEVRRLLDKTGRQSHSIDIFIIVGHLPGYDSREIQQDQQTLSILNAKMLTYDELIRRALQINEGYLLARRHTGSIASTLEHLNADLLNKA